ncbi:hypothetical protein FSP39_014076 [Pinctada imbricata]|uniref:EF-hand domain-containing protein n=1 Tax=Pinctada imbricata TaxID=66713 RepID=A0AA88XMB6_PINIB|nr:hypothetical protein FSP39_014076 [Pinctada imbricata]
MRSMGQNPTEMELKKIIEEVDKDGDGEIDFPEFMAMMGKKYRKIVSEEEEIKQAFRVFDQDGDGKITFKELKAVLTSIGEKMTEEEFRNLMREADLNGDGEISYDGRKSTIYFITTCVADDGVGGG